METLNRFTVRKLGDVRLVTKGSNEIMPALDAFEKAESMGLDLILVSNDVKPPVVRIQDQKKIEYEKKKARKANKATSGTKEIQFKVNISEHDIATKIVNIEKFLDRGDKVKILIKLKGREKEYPQRAHELLKKVTERCHAKVTFIPGPMALAMLEPLKKEPILKLPSKKS